MCGSVIERDESAMAFAHDLRAETSMMQGNVINSNRFVHEHATHDSDPRLTESPPSLDFAVHLRELSADSITRTTTPS